MSSEVKKEIPLMDHALDRFFRPALARDDDELLDDYGSWFADPQKFFDFLQNQRELYHEFTATQQKEQRGLLTEFLATGAYPLQEPPERSAKYSQLTLEETLNELLTPSLSEEEQFEGDDRKYIRLGELLIQHDIFDKFCIACRNIFPGNEALVLNTIAALVDGGRALDCPYSYPNKKAGEPIATAVVMSNSNEKDNVFTPHDLWQEIAWAPNKIFIALNDYARISPDIMFFHEMCHAVHQLYYSVARSVRKATPSRKFENHDELSACQLEGQLLQARNLPARSTYFGGYITPAGIDSTLLLNTTAFTMTVWKSALEEPQIVENHYMKGKISRDGTGAIVVHGKDQWRCDQNAVINAISITNPHIKSNPDIELWAAEAILEDAIRNNDEIVIKLEHGLPKYRNYEQKMRDHYHPTINHLPADYAFPRESSENPTKSEVEAQGYDIVNVNDVFEGEEICGEIVPRPSAANSEKGFVYVEQKEPLEAKPILHKVPDHLLKEEIGKKVKVKYAELPMLWKVGSVSLPDRGDKYDPRTQDDIVDDTLQAKAEAAGAETYITWRLGQNGMAKDGFTGSIFYPRETGETFFKIHEAGSHQHQLYLHLVELSHEETRGMTFNDPQQIFRVRPGKSGEKPQFVKLQMGRSSIETTGDGDKDTRQGIDSGAPLLSSGPSMTRPAPYNEPSQTATSPQSEDTPLLPRDDRPEPGILTTMSEAVWRFCCCCREKSQMSQQDLITQLDALSGPEIDDLVSQGLMRVTPFQPNGRRPLGIVVKQLGDDGAIFICGAPKNIPTLQMVHAEHRPLVLRFEQIKALHPGLFEIRQSKLSRAVFGRTSSLHRAGQKRYSTGGCNFRHGCSGSTGGEWAS